MKINTIWFTGLSGAGKTTLGKEVAKIMRWNNNPSVLLDGDIMRKSIYEDLGYSKEDREKALIRIAHVCKNISGTRRKPKR